MEEWLAHGRLRQKQLMKNTGGWKTQAGYSSVATTKHTWENIPEASCILKTRWAAGLTGAWAFHEQTKEGQGGQWRAFHAWADTGRRAD